MGFASFLFILFYEEILFFLKFLDIDIGFYHLNQLFIAHAGGI